MKIGLLAPPWLPVPPPLYGGTEAVVDRLARGFVEAGHDVMLWTTGDSECPVPKGWIFEKSEGFRIGIAALELRHVIHGYEALKGCDIVHDHTLIGTTYALRYPELQVVTTNHGPFNEELTDLYRAIVDRVPIIAISHDQASRASGLPIARVIHHGIDPERFPVGDGRGDERGDYHLFLGRMAPEKGARRAVEICKAVGARLILAAKMREPWEHQFFAEQVQPLLTDDITYVGEVGGQQKLDLLAGARSLVNPIRWPEPFGLVMIEALACGTPVLAFKEGAAPEIVDHGVTGFLCDNEDDMAAAIDKVADLDRAACRGAAEEQFSRRRMVADHLDLFDEILARRL